MTTTTIQKDTRVDGLHAIARDQDLGALSAAEWMELEQHVNVHRYLINQNIPWVISFDDAVFSWYENVLMPVLRAAALWEVRKAFPQLSRGRLYLAIATHWYYLCERDSSITPEQAAIDFAAQYGQGIARWCSRVFNAGR